MIYSKWLPDRGGYAYYETPERRGLGDDLPIPRLRRTSALGVASTDIGRPLPLGAKLVGYGPLAKGYVAPLDRGGLSGLPEGAASSLVLLGLGIGSAALGAILMRKLRKAT